MQVRFENKQESQFEECRVYSKTHLNTISSLLQQLQTRTNTSTIKQIWSNVQDVQTLYSNQIQKLSKIVKKASNFYLSIKQIQSLLKALATSFSEVLEEFPNRRIQSLYSQLLHISFRLRTIQPTSIHTHSTRMKQHLLDQLKDEKKKRNEIEKEYVAITEEYQKLAEVSANKLNEKQNALQEYSKIQSKFRELSHEMNLMKQTNNKLKLLNDNLKRQKNQLTKLINTPCQECVSKDRTMQELEDKIRRSLLELQKKNQEQIKMKENEEIMKSEIDGLQQKVEQLHKIRLDKQNNIVELEQQLSDTTKKLKEYIQNDNALRNKNDELERQLDDLNIQLRDHSKLVNELSQQINESKKLERQLKLERENFVLKSEELECKVEQLEGHINQLSQMQDNSEEVIRKLSRQLEQRERNTNIHKDTAERLRKQINEMKRKQDQIIEQKSDESQDDGIIRVIPREKQPPIKQGIHNVGEKKKHNKHDLSSLEDSRKRSNPEIEIVEDQLLRMLLTQALSLESFLEKD